MENKFKSKKNLFFPVLVSGNLTKSILIMMMIMTIVTVMMMILIMITRMKTVIMVKRLCLNLKTNQRILIGNGWFCNTQNVKKIVIKRLKEKTLKLHLS